MDVQTMVLTVTGLAGGSLLVFALTLLLLAVSNGRDHRWLGRHPVEKCAGLRNGSALYAVYGRTVPGPAGPVTAPLSGEEAAWFRLMVCAISASDDPTIVTVLCEQYGGEPFGVADETGVAAVSGRILQASTYNRHLSMWARTRLPVASSGPTATRRVVDETTDNWRRRGPRLQQVVDRGFLPESAIPRAGSVTVVEDIVPAHVPLHVVGKPTILDNGTVGLTLPPTGRYLVLSRDPAETEREVAGDRSYGMGCALWALLIGVVCLAVFTAVAISISR